MSNPTDKFKYNIPDFIYSQDDLDKAIINIVISRQGLRSSELIADIAMRVTISYNDAKLDVAITLENLVKEGKIVELEYILQLIPYRTKSYFFPPNTTIVGINGKTIKAIDQEF